MRFQVGDVVEVDASNEEGFHGSHWEATIVSNKISSTNDEYLVEYNEIHEDDFSARLQQIVQSHMVRSVPPKCPVKQRYRFGDRVDVFDNDGWWVGTVGGVNKDEETYYVYFEAFKIGITYHVSKLRMHQDLHNGN